MCLLLRVSPDLLGSIFALTHSFIIHGRADMAQSLDMTCGDSQPMCHMSGLRVRSFVYMFVYVYSFWLHRYSGLLKSHATVNLRFHSVRSLRDPLMRSFIPVPALGASFLSARSSAWLCPFLCSVAVGVTWSPTGVSVPP